ncbi:MAG: hypothetical protein H6911_03010 [Rickettsiaceae bacterium]|nr:hypothetical protein [Rickettsiaceae bacterium]
MSKKSKKIDQQIDSINQINLTNKIVEELLSKANPEELFGKDGLFQQLKKPLKWIITAVTGVMKKQ